MPFLPRKKKRLNCGFEIPPRVSKKTFVAFFGLTAACVVLSRLQVLLKRLRLSSPYSHACHFQGFSLHVVPTPTATPNPPPTDTPTFAPTLPPPPFELAGKVIPFLGLSLRWAGALLSSNNLYYQLIYQLFFVGNSRAMEYKEQTKGAEYIDTVTSYVSGFWELFF